MNFILAAGYIKDTGSPKGRGVFAYRDIEKGELVEVAPVVALTCRYADLQPELQRIVFHWGALAGMPGVHALVLGYGSMYNHANPANLFYRASEDGCSLCFVAVARIAAGTELTINYNAEAGHPSSTGNHWFEHMGVKLHESPSAEDA